MTFVVFTVEVHAVPARWEIDLSAHGLASLCRETIRFFRRVVIHTHDVHCSISDVGNILRPEVSSALELYPREGMITLGIPSICIPSNHAKALGKRKCYFVTVTVLRRGSVITSAVLIVDSLFQLDGPGLCKGFTQRYVQSR